MKQLIYGRHAAVEAIKNTNRKIDEVWLADDQYDIPRHIKTKHVKKEEIANKTKSVHHQNILVMTNALEPKPWENLNSVLICDQITDPQNLGAIIRSAAAFGFDAVISQDYEGLKSSMLIPHIASGGIEYVDMLFVTNVSQTMRDLKDLGFWIYGLAEKGSQNLGFEKPAAKSAYVIGSEGKGIRQLVEKTCDFLIKIPTADNFSCLNAAQSATVVMYHHFTVTNT